MLGLLFPILLVAIGTYVLVGAIRGSGKLLSTENFKEEYVEKGKKYMRIVYFCLAGVMFIMAISNLLQYALYTNGVVHYSMTEAYKTEFSEVLEKNTTDGKFSYKIEQQSQGSMLACFGGGSAQTTNQTYGPYDVNSTELTEEAASVFLYAAKQAYPEKFPQQTAQMSCFGSSSSAEDPTRKYYESKPYLDANGKQVYTSAFKGIASNAEEASFTKTLYNTFSPTFLSIVNYVCIGLAITGIVLLFVCTAKFTDKEKAAKARASYSSGGPSMPSSAFNFDDDKKEN